MVFLHVHKGYVRVGFAVAVPFPADVDIQIVPFQLFKPVIYGFNGLLQPGLMVPFSFDKCGVCLCFLCVQALSEVDTDGVIRPLLIRWHDGRQWEVTKVLHTCTASHDEFEGIRYTVKIGRAVKYLYREGRRWYVDRSP